MSKKWTPAARKAWRRRMVAAQKRHRLRENADDDSRDQARYETIGLRPMSRSSIETARRLQRPGQSGLPPRPPRSVRERMRAAGAGYSAQGMMPVLGDYSDLVADFSADDDDNVTQSLVRRLLAKLRPKNRALLTEHYLQGIGIPEMAATRGISAGAMKVQLHRAREAARDVPMRGNPFRSRNPQLLTLMNPRTLEQTQALVQASRAFRKFHGVEPRRVRKIPGEGPPLIALGTLREVVYQPTRGARRGPAFFHRFGRGAVLAGTADGQTLVVIPAPHRPFRIKWDRGIVG